MEVKSREDKRINFCTGVMADKLLVRVGADPEKADSRLVCFPWAGGGAAYYIAWSRQLPPEIDVCALRYPGREVRLTEPPYRNIIEAINNIADVIRQSLLDKPFSFMGHSLGALISFAVAVKLKEYGIEPIHMFVSGMSAPHSSQVQDKAPVSQFTQEEFIQYMKSKGGTPVEILENKDMMKIYLPILRADYRLYEEFKYDLPVTFPLTCSIDVFDGKEDHKHDLEGWRKVTSGATSISFFPGAHFYLKEPENQSKLLRHIAHSLKDIVRLSDQPV